MFFNNSTVIQHNVNPYRNILSTCHPFSIYDIDKNSHNNLLNIYVIYHIHKCIYITVLIPLCYSA